MPANKLPETVPSSRGNADYRWAEFDAEAYFNHYYGEPHPDDDRVIEYAVKRSNRRARLGRELDLVDVGTGPNLFPLFCALAPGAEFDRLGICRNQRGLAQGRTCSRRDAAAMATFLGRDASRLWPGL